ncbi:hypothetical protein LCGC14_2543650, partial [marine sediment metagenome]
MATFPNPVAESVLTPRKFDFIREETLVVGVFTEFLVENECYAVEVRRKPGELSEELHVKHQSAGDPFFEIIAANEILLKGFTPATARSPADTYTQFQPGDVIGYI